MFLPKTDKTIKNLWNHQQNYKNNKIVSTARKKETARDAPNSQPQIPRPPPAVWAQTNEHVLHSTTTQASHTTADNGRALHRHRRYWTAKPTLAGARLCRQQTAHNTHTHTQTHTDQQLTSVAKDIHHMTTIHMHHQHRRGNKQNKHGANTHRDQKWCYAYSTQQVALQAQVKILCVHVQARMPPMSAVCTKRCMQFNSTKQQHKSNAACKPASLH